jgi:hypothetical protein
VESARDLKGSVLNRHHRVESAKDLGISAEQESQDGISKDFVESLLG